MIINFTLDKRYKYEDGDLVGYKTRRKTIPKKLIRLPGNNNDYNVIGMYIDGEISELLTPSRTMHRQYHGIHPINFAMEI